MIQSKTHLFNPLSWLMQDAECILEANKPKV